MPSLPFGGIGVEGPSTHAAGRNSRYRRIPSQTHMRGVQAPKTILTSKVPSAAALSAAFQARFTIETASERKMRAARNRGRGGRRRARGGGDDVGAASTTSSAAWEGDAAARGLGAEDEKAQRQQQQQQHSHQPTGPRYVGRLETCQLCAEPSDEEWGVARELARARGQATGCCSICQDEYGMKPQVLTSCSHVFHKVCLGSFERFNGGRRVCPICRSSGYRKRDLFDGAEHHLHKSAVAVQRVFRGYRARKKFAAWLEDANPPSAEEPERRKAYLLRKIGAAATKMVSAVEKGSSNIDSLFAEMDDNLNLSRAAMSAVEVRMKILSDDEWDIAKRQADARRDLQCPICMGGFECGQHAKSCTLLSCSHVFHASCLSSFESFASNAHGAQNMGCPLCREPYQKRPYVFPVQKADPPQAAEASLGRGPPQEAELKVELEELDEDMVLGGTPVPTRTREDEHMAHTWGGAPLAQQGNGLKHAERGGSGKRLRELNESRQQAAQTRRRSEEQRGRTFGFWACAACGNERNRMRAFACFKCQAERGSTVPVLACDQRHRATEGRSMYDRVDRLTRSTKNCVSAYVAAGRKGEKVPGGFGDQSSRVMSEKLLRTKGYDKARVHAEALVRERSAAALHKGQSAVAGHTVRDMRRQH